MVRHWDVDFEKGLEFLGGMVGRAFWGSNLKNWVDNVTLILKKDTSNTGGTVGHRF